VRKKLCYVDTEGLLIDVKHKRGQAIEAIQGIEDEIQNLYITVKCI